MNLVSTKYSKTFIEYCKKMHPLFFIISGLECFQNDIIMYNKYSYLYIIQYRML
jgi:hypothetical protein